MSVLTYNGMKVRELPRQEVGVSWNDPSSRREWLLTGSSNRDIALGAAELFVPAIDTCAGVARFFERYDLKEESTGAWSLKAQYRKNPAYWELSIDTSGGTGKILQSFNTVKGYDCLGRVPNEDPTSWQLNGAIADFQRAIGVNGNQIEGVDVVIPKFDFSISYKMKMSTLSALYLMTLYDLTGKANHAKFDLSWKGQTLTFQQGDLRFLGAPCKLSSDDNLDITFRFSASKSIAVSVGDGPWLIGSSYVEDDLVDGTDATGTKDVVYRCLVGHDADADNEPPNAAYWEAANITIGDSIPISKRGWEYLWVQYEERLDRETNRMVRVPIAAYVEQVCKYGNFGLLGIS